MKALFLTVCAATMLVAAPVMAKDYPKGGVTADEVASDLKGIKHTAKIGKDSQGDPLIEASFDINGTAINYKIFFYGCDKGRCKSIQYHVAFDGSPKKLEQWNKEHRFARAWVSGEKLIHLEYDVDVEAGANTVSVQNATERFKAVMVDGVRFWSE